MDPTELIVLLVLFLILLVLVIWIFWPGLNDPPITITEPATPATIGETCNITTLCNTGLICETTCRGTSGTSCGGNYQCSNELYCVGLILSTDGRVLKPGTCEARPLGGLDQPCPTCEAGYICDESFKPPVCKGAEGTMCTINDDCFYRVCGSGVCEGGQIQADPCSTDFEPFVQGLIVSSSRCDNGLICDTTGVQTEFGPSGTAGYCQAFGIDNGTDQAFCAAGQPFPQPNNMLPPGCNTGLVCIDNTCHIGRQFWGQPCIIDSENALNICNPPLVCGVGPGGVIEPVCVYPEFPNTCDITGDCSVGQQCLDGDCLVPTGGFCTVDSECLLSSCDPRISKIWRWTGNAKIDPSTTGWTEHSTLPTEVVFTTFNASNVTLWGVSTQNTELSDIVGYKLTANSSNSVSSALGGIYQYILPITTLDRPRWEKVFPHQVIETIVISGTTVTRTTTIKDITAPNNALIFDGSPLVVANVKLVYLDTTEVQNDALYLLKELPQIFEEGTIPQDQCFASALTFGRVLVPFNPTVGDAIQGTQHTVVPMVGDEVIFEIVDLDVSEQQDVILHGSATGALDFLFLRTMEITNYFLQEQGSAVPRFYNASRGCSEFNYSRVSDYTSSSDQKIVFNGTLTGQVLPHPGLTVTTRNYEISTYQHFNTDQHEFVNSANTLMLAKSTNVTDTPHNIIMVEGLLQSMAPGYVDGLSLLTAASHGQYLMSTGTCSS